MNIRFHIHGDGQFDAKNPIGPCVWPHFDLLTVHSGLVCIELAHCNHIELRPGQSVLIYPHTHFVGKSIAKRSRAFVQHFELNGGTDTDLVVDPVGRLIGRTAGFEVYPQKASRQFLNDVRRAVVLAHTPATDLSTREALMRLILCQLSAQGNNDKLSSDLAGTDFAALIRWVTSDFSRLATIDKMAEYVGLSTSHFREQFRRQIGVSPGQFLRQRRHLEAARLLRETGLPIKLISQRVGYGDLAHFYRFFTQLAKLTPQTYRTKYRLRG